MELIIKNLSFGYHYSQVLKNINFKASEGNLVCILGKNGVGKSTLFKCVLGLLSGYKGSIEVDGKDIKTMCEQELASKVAYIPQSHNSTFNFSVMDMVLMGTTSRLGRFGCPGHKEKKIVLEALKSLNIEHLINRNYSKLSGGEQQLVLIARAISQQAKILIMDEPCANLDYGNQIQVMKKVKELSGKGYLIIQSTHNPDHALLFADKVLAIVDGAIVAYGKTEETITEKLLEKIYGISISLLNVENSKYKICIPKEGIEYVAII
ncbi:ABC transporter ATP-binding protein [Clostridium gasigenes]|uniref:ABC transporter ATP-binding protein n=1 Tax=Clostridium gasigenes TaxID=94869 RepID=UPI001628F552|nr:ABC transporter ATP-binding protein [Clostridium gasigenes]MBB6625054.1 ABC transporter ATP-binding protein [Clostridium gasigenes]MBU3090256.1 ABC transporter ATP-binding protein [Clostridium gasigenes]